MSDLQHTVAETGESLAEDRLGVSGVLSTGAIASVDYRGGMTRGAIDERRISTPIIVRATAAPGAR
jgi:hypothetical protein